MTAITVQEREYDDSIIWPTSMHPLLQRIYAARGLTPDISIELQLKDLLPPDELKNIQQASELLSECIMANKSIIIIGDFDADGATSTALAKKGLTAMGADYVSYLVPNRFEYGYGLTTGIVQEALRQNPDLIMTVDNGISSHDGVALARKHHVKVLITDHHLQGDTLPNADVIVNPNQKEDAFISKSLAGVGVVFYILIALRQQLRKNNWFNQASIDEPQLAQYLDLVALGTVADVVPLDQNNRILVSEGLKRIQSGLCVPGITALLEISGRLPFKALASDLGFSVGPRLNAAGRLDDMSIGIECLLADDVKAKELAFELDALNGQRRTIEDKMKTEALSHLEKIDLQDSPLFGLVLFDDDWHQGVIGILASRIKDKIHRPVIIFAVGDDDQTEGVEMKGSCRSIKGIHIRDVLEAISTQYPRLIKKFGGHAMAAGLSIDRENFKLFCDVFNEQIKCVATPEILHNTLLTDGQLSRNDFSLEVAKMLNDAGPWGQAFSEPLFSGEFKVISQRILKEKHYKLLLSPTNCEQDFCIDGIAFNQVDENTSVSQRVLPDTIQIVYKLSINEFRGQQNLQLMIDYIMVN